MLKTKLEIIQETVAYYSEDVSRRAVCSMSGCWYYTDDGKMCAVGRCLSDPASFASNGGLALQLFSSAGFSILKEDYRVNDIEFWNQLQHLHDMRNHWNESGLTEQGERYLAKLITTYS